MANFAPSHSIFTDNIFRELTKDDMVKLLLHSFDMRGVQRNQVLPDYSTEHLISVISILSSGRAILERPLGTGINVIVYPELSKLPRISEKFIVDKPFRAKRVEPTKLAPTAKSIEITKRAETVVIGASYVFETQLLTDLTSVFDDEGEGKGISRFSLQNFLRSYTHQDQMVRESFLAGTSEQYICFLKEMGEDILIKEALVAGKEEYTSRMLMIDNTKLAQIIDNYERAKCKSTGIINENPEYFSFMVQKAIQLVTSTPLIRDKDVILPNPADSNVIPENDDIVAGVLLVGNGVKQFLSTEKLKMGRDVRRAVVEFTAGDYQSAMETKWIISDSDAYSDRQKKAAEVCKTGQSKTMVKSVVKAKPRAYDYDSIPTTNKKENVASIVLDVDCLKIDGKIVIVDAIDDIFNKTNDVSPLRDQLSFIQCSVLGSTGAMDLNDPNRNKLPARLGIVNSNERVSWISYQDTIGMLTSSKFFDNKYLAHRLNQQLLGKVKVHFHYCPCVLSADQIHSDIPPHVRLPRIDQWTFLGNRADYLGRLSYEESCSPIYSDETMLEVSPAFDFYLVKKPPRNGLFTFNEKVRMISGPTDEADPFQIQGFPRRIQANFPLCYTGKNLWWGQAHQLLSVFGESVQNKTAISEWMKSLQTKTYWFELYVTQYILTSLYSDISAIAMACDAPQDPAKFSVIRYLLLIGDRYFEETGLLPFPQSLICLRAWAGISEYQNARNTVSEILHFIFKITDGLMNGFQDIKDVDTLSYLSPLTDSKVPCPINVRGFNTNVCSNTDCHIEKYSQSDDHYSWEVSHDLGRESLRDNIQDKVFLSCLCSLANELHTGFIDEAQIKTIYNNNLFYLSKKYALIHLDPNAEDKEEKRNKCMKDITQFITNTISNGRSAVYRLRSDCPNSLHNDQPVYNSYSFMTNGILFLSAELKSQNSDIDFSEAVKFVYLEPRLASPRVPAVLHKDNSSAEGFITNTVVKNHPDPRFYTLGEHDYTPMSVLTQQTISRHFLDPVVAIYASVASQLRIDPVAFALYSTKVNPPLAFTVLKTAAYRTEHAFYVPKKGHNIFIAPENQLKASPDNNSMNIQVYKRLAFIDNTPGTSVLCLRNIFIRGQITSDECFMRDYHHNKDKRGIFAKLRKYNSLLRPNFEKKSYGFPNHTILDILPCPCPIDPATFESPVCPLGRNLASAYINGDPRVYSDHSLPDCKGMSTFNPWASHDICLGRHFYGETDQSRKEGFYNFYDPLLTSHSDINDFIRDLKSKCKDQTTCVKKYQDLSSLFLVAWPMRSFTEGALEASRRNERVNYLIDDKCSPLAQKTIPKIRGGSCLSHL